MALDEMTPEEFRQKLDELLGEEYFPPIAVTRDGEPRMVVVPIVAWRSMRRGSRLVMRCRGDDRAGPEGNRRSQGAGRT